jgi:serine/threonine-protein kinase
MELLEGESLRKRLARHGKLPPVDVARIVSQLARGLEAAHGAGIVHRDLKPQNIFLAKDQDREVVKIVDFGIAKRLDLKGIDRLSTQDGLMVGTPCYMSPEQVMGTAEIDARSDLWQIAVVAFECICGERPFDHEAVGELMMMICTRPVPVPSQVTEVPPGFDAWFARATSRDPAGRYQTAKELADSLCAVLAPHTTSAALADSLPAWAPPVAASNPGLLFEQSHAGLLNTTARDAWASQQSAGKGLTHRRAILTAALIALPVAVAATIGGMWLMSATGLEATEDPAAPSSSAVTVDAAVTSEPTAESVPTAEPVPTGSSEATSAPAPDAAAPAAPRPAAPDAGTDAGRWAPPSPRRVRPEDILGI